MQPENTRTPNSTEYAQARFANFSDGSFDLAEKVFLALYTSVPENHPIRTDPDIVEYLEMMSNGIKMVPMIPSIDIVDNKVVHKPGDPDLEATTIDMINQMAPVLSKINKIANKLEQAGFEVYGLEIC